MRFRNLKKFAAFSLVEILVALAIFAIVAGSIGVFAVDSFRSNQNSRLKQEAALYLQEIAKALQMTKDNSWKTIMQNTNNGPKKIVFQNNQYKIVDGSDLKDGITLNFTINSVYRDVNGNIVSNGGTLDVHSRELDVIAVWSDGFGQNKTITLKDYVNDWSILTWLQTTAADFNAGTKTYTIVTNDSDGEVALDTILLGDWCKPAVGLQSFDLPGQGVAKTISAIAGTAYIGTGNNSSGYSLAKVLISNSNPPVATLGNTFNGYKTNGIFGDAQYSYLATDSNSKEAVIVDTSGQTYNEVGYFDAPGNGTGNAIYVSNNIGYLTDGTKLYSFDLSSRTGSRPQKGVVSLNGSGVKMVVKGNYAYIAETGSTREMEIVDITNPASMSVIGYADVNSLSGVDVALNSDSSRAYLITNYQSGQNDFFVIDTNVKTGSRPSLSGKNTNGMNPAGITVPIDNRAIIVGSGGTQQYQVYDITNDAAPSSCGGLALNASATGVASVVDQIGNTYSYVITSSSSSEMKIIKGGAGGGNGQGQGFPTYGEFDSQIFDTGSTTTGYTTLNWTMDLPAGTAFQMQLRFGNTLAELNANPWIGPNGTNGTYYSNPSGEYINSGTQNTRYVQFKASFYSDTTHLYTPILQSVTINYQK